MTTTSLGTFVSGTNGPALVITFSRPNVGAIDLTGATVTANIHRPNATDITKSLTVLMPSTNGQAQLNWATGDLVATTQEETYMVDFLVTISGATEGQPIPATLLVRPAVA